MPTNTPAQHRPLGTRLLLTALCLFAGAVRADVLPVQVFSANYQDGGTIESRFPALIEARRSSALGFDSSGRIAQITVDTGDRVEAGALLARLDTRTLEAEHAAAEAQARASEARAELASATLARETRLVNEGHVSPQRLEEVSAEARAVQAVAAAARADVAALKVRIDLARIEAPFAGVITERLTDEGAIAGAGTPVLRIVEDGSLELRVGLPYEDARKLIVGRNYPADIAGKPMDVQFRASTGVIDGRRRTVTTVFDLPPGTAARSGETAELRLPTRMETRGFWAPITALSEGRRGLWTVLALATREDGSQILEARPVSVEYLEAERAFVSGAVAEGTLLVAAGVHRVVPGQRVRPVQER